VSIAPNKIAGRLGMNFVERVALNAKCKPIPVPEDMDTGIDGLLEFEYGDRTRLVAFQVKRGTSFFDGDAPKVDVKTRHLRLWRGYEVPVLLIVVRDDDSLAHWVDVRQLARDSPALLNGVTRTVRPPLNHVFDVHALTDVIAPLASLAGFGDIVALLSDPEPERRESALGLLYRHRNERRAPFVLAAAARLENRRELRLLMWDFYSRYFSHPETSFGVAPDLSAFAAQILRDGSGDVLSVLIRDFEDEERFGDWSGAVEIFAASDEEVWDRFDVIERGTVQQGIAELIRHVGTRDRLLAHIRDESKALAERKSAVALFGYLGHSCEPTDLDPDANGAVDLPLRALLTWLRRVLIAEGQCG
jgi:hypothetical protein